MAFPSLLNGLTIFALLGVSVAGPVDRRADAVVGDKFNLYAWGNNIPGLQLFYADGRALYLLYSHLRVDWS
jgi:hypothetical protein